jgi:DNA mismatch repair protein MutL
MPVIHQLSPSIVNKIAAGEVIERPASVVKELLENAVDAGATRIDVTVGQGGAELVRVVDNGCGIATDQLPLAVAPHATSKIADADDLFRIGTLGFRGEALASIAEVSRLVLRSRPAEAEAGAEIVVSGGHAEPVAPCGCPVGTAIEVHNLFFNTPVRRKFLRTAQTELGHASEAFTRIALAFPQVHFTLRHHDKAVYDLPPVEAWTERVAAVFGGDLADALIPVESVDGAVRLTGYAAHPSQTRSHPKMQYVLLNGRAIRDRALQHALSEAYRGLVLTGRYPIAFLRIEMPPESVDVNVHPTKLEVRFADSGRLYSQLLGTLRTKFLTVDLNTKLRPEGAGSRAQGAVAGAWDEGRGASDDPNFAVDQRQALRQREELVAWAKGELAGQGTESSGQWPVVGDQAGSGSGRKPLELVKFDRPPVQTPLHSPSVHSASAHSPTVSVGMGAGKMPQGTEDTVPTDTFALNTDHQRMGAGTSPIPAMQVHNRYLIAESDDGVVVIDQHALHERILYEQLRERVLAGALETQRLLVPEAVDLSPAEAAAALTNQELLAKLGVEVAAFGGDTVLVTSYPAMLANFRPAEVLHDLVARLLAEGKQPDRRDMVDELLHMIACKAAIKAGDRLTAEEVTALVEMRHLAQDSHHCPHGRPTALVFTREELDRQFLRT